MSLSGDVIVDAAGAFDTCNSASVVRGGAGTEREGARFDSIPEQRCTENEGLLIPGCGTGYGAGLLDLGLADQCSTLLRELFKVRCPSCLVATTGDSLSGMQLSWW